MNLQLLVLARKQDDTVQAGITCDGSRWCSDARGSHWHLSRHLGAYVAGRGPWEAPNGAGRCFAALGGTGCLPALQLSRARVAYIISKLARHAHSS